MIENTEIRRHQNGSIDVEYYARVGRRLHGQAFADAGKWLKVVIRRVYGNLKMRLHQQMQDMYISNKAALAE